MRVSAICLAGAVFASAFGASAGPTALPHQKVGLWQQTLSRDGKPMGAASVQICLDDAIQKKFTILSRQMAGKKCQMQTVIHNGDGSWSSDSICTVGNGMTISGHTTVSGDFNSKFVITTVSTMTGAPVAAMDGKHEIEITSTWTGPCKADQKPGDMIMANGMKLNMLDMENAMHSATSPGH